MQQSSAYNVNKLAVSVKHRQPHPDGHTSRFSNHCFKCLVCPPCPQTIKQFADPRTDKWHIMQFNENFLHVLQVQCLVDFAQFLHSVENSTPLWLSGGLHRNFNTSARLYNSPHLWSTSAYDNLKYSYKWNSFFRQGNFSWPFKRRLSREVDLIGFKEARTHPSVDISVGGIVW